MPTKAGITGKALMGVKIPASAASTTHFFRHFLSDYLNSCYIGRYRQSGRLAEATMAKDSAFAAPGFAPGGKRSKRKKGLGVSASL
jgi:hypothetical protein